MAACDTPAALQLHIMRHVTSIIDEYANRRAPPAAENEQPAGERIGFKLLLTQPRQRIDALAAIHRFQRHQDAHLRRDLDHASPSHNARLSATNSAVAIPLICILIRPRGPSNSTRHSGKLRGRMRMQIKGIATAELV